MTHFRPCIDLHGGFVKQIVGGSLRDDGSEPETNHVSERVPAWYAQRYCADALTGGHVIKLGPGNDAAARSTLGAWPGGLQLGGGVDVRNAARWIEAGASHVIVTSCLFEDGALCMDRVRAMSAEVGPERLVIDLSCRRLQGGWRVATDRWQTVTSTEVNRDTLHMLAEHCDEFLVHAADVEGKCEGIDEALVALLGHDCPRPCTYAGGARAIEDLATVERLSGGRVDLTFGSALDLFGGSLVRYDDCVAWNRGLR